VSLVASNVKVTVAVRVSFTPFYRAMHYAKRGIVTFGLGRAKVLSVQLLSKISNLCGPDPPTLQTDRRTDDVQSQYHALQCSTPSLPGEHGENLGRLKVGGEKWRAGEQKRQYF